MDQKTFEKMKAKMDENAAQIVVGKAPTAKYCRSCMWAYEDTKYTVGAEKAHCQIYEMPESKPNDVLWKDAECPAYVKK